MVAALDRVTVVVLDSVGVGEAPDAAAYGDEGSSTLPHVAHSVGGLRLPHLQALGLGNVADIAGVPPVAAPRAAWGRMTQRSAGKDTTTGHWEMMGVILHRPFPVYPNGFPQELLAEFQRRCGRLVIGNRPASGTQIIEELFHQHVRTGALIVYTSADSVFQIAAHEDIVPVAELYRCCAIARALLTGEHAVARVIARPFVGQPGDLSRTDRRRDFSLPPPQDTVLDRLTAAGVHVCAIGKIGDIFAHRGVSEEVHTSSNVDGCRQIISQLDRQRAGMIFANLNDFDSKWGHRSDVHGYAAGLVEVDSFLPGMLERLTARDLFVLTADHGCDPTTASTDHSREQVPLLVTGGAVRGVPLGVRETFADLGATICAAFGIPEPPTGMTFLTEVLT